MIYSNTPNPPAKFTATMWGKTVTIELNHSDFDLSELMEIFKGLTIASGFSNDSWNSVIKELSAQIHEDETEDLKEKLNEWKNEADDNEWKDLRHNTTKDGLDEWKARNGFGSSTGDSKDKAPFKEFGDEDDEVIDDARKRYNKDSEGYENLDELENDFFGPIEEDEEAANKRMDIIGQNGNEGTHYTYDWDNSNSYEGESNTILHNINDSITLIKDRMVDIDLKMDNIDEQLGILNADVANIELNIQHPLKRTLLNAKEVYDKSLIETGRQLFQKQKVAMDKYNSFNDVVDMETGEVSYDEDGGFAVKMNKDVVKKGKIKDLKK